jgi:hypothetical protein
MTALSVALTAYRVERPDRRLAVVPRITLHPSEPVPCRLTPR